MPDAPGAGVASPVRSLARTLLSFVETRARLAANEIEEHSLRLTEVALWVLAAFACAGVALVMLSLLVVLLFRDGERLLAAAVVAAVWIAAAVACVLAARARQRQRPRPLSATLAELHKDRQRFGNPDA
jgi:uncharacterized membrane protein YqjE